MRRPRRGRHRVPLELGLGPGAVDLDHRAAVEGVGVALGRLTMVRPLIEAGRLVELGRRRLSAEYAHWFVYPPRSEGRPALVAFRAWLLRVSGSRAGRRPPG